jgi:hypothetical protein
MQRCSTRPLQQRTHVIDGERLSGYVVLPLLGR